MRAGGKKKEGNAQEKWIICVQKDMDKYGLKLEDAEDIDQWLTMIEGE